MTLESKLKEAVLEEISEINPDTIGFVMPKYIFLAKALNLLINERMVSVSELNGALEKSIAGFAKKYCESKRSEYIDHTLNRPEIMAYAMVSNMLTDKEISRIKFDPGETSASYIKSYNPDNVIDNLRELLLNPKTTEIPHFGLDDSEPSECFESH